MTLNGDDFTYTNLQGLTVQLIATKGQDVVLAGSKDEVDTVLNAVHSQEFVDYYDGPGGEYLMSPGNKKLYLQCL